MALEIKDVELIETIFRKISDDIIVASRRSLERVEERIDCAETRLYSRISDIEDQIADKDEIGRRAIELLRDDIRVINHHEF